MKLYTDNFGMTAKVNAKLYNMEFSTLKNLAAILKNEDSEIIIVTFSLPGNPDFLCDIFDIRSQGVTIVANTKYAEPARTLKERWPDIRIYLDPNVHAKMVMADPDRVWVGSGNLGMTRSAEGTVGLEGRAAFGYFMDELERHDYFDPTKEVLLELRHTDESDPMMGVT